MRDKARRTFIGIVGGFVLLVGIIAIPYPGPGWLIVFAGLAILATEFEKAQRVLDYAQKEYDNWQGWLRKQSRFIQVIFFLVTAVIVIVTLWLLNAYGILNHLFNLGLDWVDSPFFN